jgi:hypothetical protein
MAPPDRYRAERYAEFEPHAITSVGISTYRSRAISAP